MKPVPTLLLALCTAAAVPAQGIERRGSCSTEPAAVMAEVNEVRELDSPCAQSGDPFILRRLAWSAGLERVALRQAEWLASLGRLVHAGPKGQTLAERADEVGYPYVQVSENLAMGQRSLAQVLAAWRASLSHCQNLYDGQVSEAALACVPAADGRLVWVLVLGRPLRPAAAARAR